MDHDRTPAAAPELLPVLAAGRHRSPRRGACFMEMASFLAGERWSDHPACTHPLLAVLARHTNDRTADAARPRLALLVPRVVGLVTSDQRTSDVLDARLALLCALRALPVAAAGRQRVMAVAALACDRVLADLADLADVGATAATGASGGGAPSPEVAEALAAEPHAASWARAFSPSGAPPLRAFRRQSAPHVVAQAVEALAATGRADTDDLLHDLLADAVALAEDVLGAGAARRGAAAPALPLPGRSWDDVVALTGAAR